MELTEAMRTLHACRYYAPDPVPDSVFYTAIEVARFGPQGGNRQPVRFLIVRDEAKKRQLAEWYLAAWKPYIDALREGSQTAGHAHLDRAMEDADNFADNLGGHPAIVVVCADLAATHPTDSELDRPSIVSGASIYPLVQNFCLALRDAGVASTLTTLLCAYEPQVKELLEIPDGIATAAHIVAGYPAKPFPRKLTRLPVEELAYTDTWGVPLTQ